MSKNTTGMLDCQGKGGEVPEKYHFATAAGGRIATAADGRNFLHPIAGCDILIVEKGKARDTQPTLNNDYLIT